MTAQSGRRNVLELHGIHAGYGRSRVLQDVDLVVPQHAVVALLGANGAGKTTVLRVASGLLRPTAGTVKLADADVTKHNPHTRTRAGLCHIPEGRGIFPSLTVRDNLELSIPPWTKNTNLDHVLTIFPPLADRLRQTAGTMSGGEQQMLALARAFLANPTIVLIDEVSMGLAPRIVDELFTTLARLVATGTALLLVEQYVTRALDMADHVYLLNKGEITFAGTPDEVATDSLMATYLGAAATDGS